MKRFNTKLALLLTLLMVSGLMASALAQKATKTKTGNKAAKTATAEAKFLAKGDGIEYCAVSGEKLENKNIKGEFFGREVYFCCNDCLETAKKNPTAYVKKTEMAQIAAVKAAMAKAGSSHGDHGDHHGKPAGEAKFLGKGDGVETCPVTGEAISKEVSVDIDGRTVYACCPGCLDKIKKNPELYLKPATK